MFGRGKCISVVLGLLFLSIKVRGNCDSIVRALNLSAIENPELCERIMFYSKHPLAINRVDFTALTDFPFLSHRQVFMLYQYRNRVKVIRHLSELHSIPGFSSTLINTIGPYLTLTHEKRRKHKASYVFHSISKEWGSSGVTNQLFRSELNIGGGSARCGFKLSTKGIMGSRRLYIPRYYLNKKSSGIVRDVHLGQYSLRLSNGLIMNRPYNYAYLNFVSGSLGKTLVFRPSLSSSNRQQMHGLAAITSLGKFRLGSFVSRTQPSGSAEHDEQGRTLIRSFSDDPSKKIEELKQVDVVNQFMFSTKAMEIAFNHVYTILSNPYDPVLRSYNHHYPRGKRFHNYSLSHLRHWTYFTSSTEVAFDQEADFAVLTTLSTALTDELEMIGALKYYGQDFQSFSGATLNKGSYVNDEIGGYLQMTYNWHPSMALVFRSEHTKKQGASYRSNYPSLKSSQVISYQRAIEPLKFEIRLKHFYELRDEKSRMEGLGLIAPYLRNQIFVRLERTGSISLKNEVVFLKDNKGKGGLTLAVGVKMSRKKMELSAVLAAYDTPNWDNRVYAYHYFSRYQYNSVLYYGEGIYANVKAKFLWHENFHLSLRTTIQRFVRGEELTSFINTSLFLQYKF